jgi:mevalonate kinase
MELCKGKRAEKIIKEMYSEMKEIAKRIDRLLEDLNNIFSKTDFAEVRNDLDYLYKKLESLKDGINSYCIEDCSICPEKCDLLCNTDCHECPRFFKCISEKKISRMVFD